ncbi:hypothetical protein GALMADRAFT_247336 [Galerina marginata CBS 339.88]|uniref:Crinkler effector protein N-terminal domain-containing protein n=1 Tax=Galerina marginata (strain CBS 339.88) TaxID=685588 RepID=A0A067T887_GALM3|nr:hypothetical protein GALMADRAFT_247336 [Galerina marginata CBS 339.88]
MPGIKLRITCLLWPDDKPNEHLVEVKINIDDTIMCLKKMIRDEHSPTLDKVPVRDLVLWECSIPVDDNLQETLSTIHFDVSDPHLRRLPPASGILEHFTTAILPRKTIHVLVEVPALENVSPPASFEHQHFNQKDFVAFEGPSNFKIIEMKQVTIEGDAYFGGEKVMLPTGGAKVPPIQRSQNPSRNMILFNKPADFQIKYAEFVSVNGNGYELSTSQSQVDGRRAGEQLQESTRKREANGAGSKDA